MNRLLFATRQRKRKIVLPCLPCHNARWSSHKNYFGKCYTSCCPLIFVHTWATTNWLKLGCRRISVPSRVQENFQLQHGATSESRRAAYSMIYIWCELHTFQCFTRAVSSLLIFGEQKIKRHLWDLCLFLYVTQLDCWRVMHSDCFPRI